MSRSCFFSSFMQWLFPGTLLLTLSCRYGDDPITAPENKNQNLAFEVYKEERGLKLILENATTKAPAKVSILFRARTSLDSAITNLACCNFTLFEDNDSTSQFESEFKVKNNPEAFGLHVLLLLDLSGSIVDHDKSLDSLKLAVSSFVRKLFFASRKEENEFSVDLGVYWFDGEAAIHQLVDFTSDSLKLQDAIALLNKNIITDKSTNLHGAVIEGIKKIQTKVGKAGELINDGALVIFSDGTDRAARRTFQEALNAVQNSGPLVSVYTIGLGGEGDDLELCQLAKNGACFEADAIEHLVTQFENAAAEIEKNTKSRYLLEYCSPKRQGRHELKIKAYTVDKTQGKIYGSLTISFPADHFSGGCQLYNPCDSRYGQPCN